MDSISLRYRNQKSQTIKTFKIMITSILLIIGCAFLGYCVVMILIYVIEFILDLINLIF